MVNDNDVSCNNVTLARLLLEEADIAISHEDTGGGFIRKISFDTSNGEVLINRLCKEELYG
ncbi:MAG: hypothetical protein PF637_09685 [Spirochaetes bacterium]|nr:hypothetical protein [Spirochaetota bacterium]